MVRNQDPSSRPLSCEYYENIAGLIDKTVINADQLLGILQTKGQETKSPGPRSSLTTASKLGEISSEKSIDSPSDSSSSYSRRFRNYVDTPSRSKSQFKRADSLYIPETGRKSRSSSGSRRTPAPSRCARVVDAPLIKSQHKPNQVKQKQEVAEPTTKQGEVVEQKQGLGGKKPWSSSLTRQTLGSTRGDSEAQSSRSRITSPRHTRPSSSTDGSRVPKSSYAVHENTAVSKKTVAVRTANDGKLITIMNANNVYISCGCCRTAKRHVSKHGNFYLTIGRSPRAPVLNDDMSSAACERDNKTSADSNSLYADGTKKIPRARTPPKKSPPSKGSKASNDEVNLDDDLARDDFNAKLGRNLQKEKRSSKNLPRARTPPRSPASGSHRRSRAGFSPPTRRASLNVSTYFDQTFRSHFCMQPPAKRM